MTDASLLSADPQQTAAEQALLNACRALLTPLAELAVSRGLQFGALDELLRAAMVDAALAAHPELPSHRSASRVSTATGLNRREVGRLIAERHVDLPRRSPATELFTRWLSDPAMRGADGAPLPWLPRLGPAPSFESLAQSVTKDVHPRSLLEEVCRLRLTALDDAGDRVLRLRDRFVPDSDEPRLLGFVAANVGDHLRAAVANVRGSHPRHVEQALFADELSADSIARLQPLLREQWQQLLRALAPQVQQLIDDDAAQGRETTHRLRVGFYSYAEDTQLAASRPERKSAADRKAALTRRSST